MARPNSRSAKKDAEHDQDIDTGAVNRRKDDLPRRCGQPARLEWYIRKLLYKVRESGEGEILAQSAEPIARLTELYEGTAVFERLQRYSQEGSAWAVELCWSIH